MGAQHTPGPWVVCSADSALAPGYVMTKGGTYIAKPLFNTEANACLIAAAPELLEALIRTRELFCAVEMTRNQIAAYNVGSEAIRKARGAA